MNDDAIKVVIKYLKPHKAIGFEKIRIGGDYDGGYICIDDFHNIKLALCGGVAHDDRWEMGMARDRNIQTIAFDPCDPSDPRSVPTLPYKLYAGKLEAFPKTRNSMLDVLLLPYNKHEVIGKIDIEGDEWKLLSYTQDSTLVKFRQLVMEFHLDGKLETLAEYGNVFEKLYKNFRVVHIHGNNWGMPHRFGDINIPDVLEVTFANIDYYTLAVSNEVFPTALDMPNCAEREDVYLGTFTL